MKTILNVLKEAFEGKQILVHKKGEIKNKDVVAHIISVNSFEEDIMNCSVVLHHNDGKHTQQLNAHYNINELEYEIIPE